MPDIQLLLQFLVNGVSIGCVYGLIGIGFCVIYNASGIVNFAQGAFVMLGGIVTQGLMARAGLGLLPAAAIAVLAVSVAGAVIERLVIRPLWHRRATMFVMILATLAVQIVLERLTLIAVGDSPLTLPAFTAGGPLHLGGVAISYQMLWIAGGSLLLVTGLGLFFARTRTGRAMRACAMNPEAASLLAIPVSALLTLSFALSAGLGAVAGILVTPTQYTAYNVGVPFAISGFIAAILGGFGNAAGAFLGGIMLGVAQSLAIVTFGAGTKNVVALSIMLAFLLIRPSGLLGTAKAA
jgi:branched-chain amino acid transport system permease protein